MKRTARKLYSTDLTNTPWGLLEGLLSEAQRGGRPRKTNSREVVNAIMNLNRSGIQRDLLPHDFPDKSTVCEYFATWRSDDTWQQVLDILREVAREHAEPEHESIPTAASIDSQTVKTAETAGDRGYDGGKKITGRKRTIAVDSLGFLLAVVVSVASLDHAKAAVPVIEQLNAERYPNLEVVWADNKYHNHNLYKTISERYPECWRLEIISRIAGMKSFVLLPKRWVVERTLAWLGRARRLSEGNERRTDSSESMVRIRGIQLLLNRLQPKPSRLFKYT